MAIDGASVIHLVITTEYDCDDDTMNATNYLVTCELTIHRVTIELVDEVIGEL